MKLGFLTACLPGWPLERIAAWAEQRGYEALEVACWPSVGGRDFEASHVPVTTLDVGGASELTGMIASHHLAISSLAYYENNLAPDPVRREAIHAHLKAVIDAAVLLGVDNVGTFIGRDPGKSVAENQKEGERVLPPLEAYAGERGIKLVIENCVMEGWHPDGYPGNLAYSPELWEWMFGLGFYLNWDPSHLMWLGIDPVSTIAPYADRIIHAQAKDIQLDAAARNRYGCFGKMAKSNPWEMGWWRYRVPGLGEVDWVRVVDKLYEVGYTGTLSVEHEDPLWGGTEEKVLIGLDIAYRTLRPLIVA